MSGLIVDVVRGAAAAAAAADDDDDDDDVVAVFGTGVEIVTGVTFTVFFGIDQPFLQGGQYKT